jgi:DNA (cytosine-5)-methyltransferase 1
MARKPYRVVDLFCGCGGISRGFQRSGRYRVEFGVESELHPVRAFRRNIVNSAGDPTPVFHGDIHSLIDSKRVFWDNLLQAGICGPGEIDVLVGGPPCQGFSRNGVRQYVESGARFYDDPRNHLYRAFLDSIEALRPKAVLIENVREFLNFGDGKFSDDLLKKLDELGYTAGFQKVSAADFGVPQVRHRVFFIAIDRDFAKVSSDALPFPLPRFSEPNPQLGLLDSMYYRTVRDAISDLPAPVYVHGKPIHYPKVKIISDYAAEMRSRSGLLHNHVARKLSAKSLARIKAVGTGRMKNIQKSLRTKSFYGSAYRRLEWDEPALTITTWVYHVGSGRFAHPSEDRGITMREAARLQSFDDDFIFPDLINPVSQMIGNAVPPLLAKTFADSLARFLDSKAIEKVAMPMKMKRRLAIA